MTTELLDKEYLAERLTSSNVDDMSAILKRHFDGKNCVLILIHPNHDDGCPSAAVVTDQLSHFHTSHFSGGRACLFFKTGDTTQTVPVGPGDPRTSQSGVDHAATIVLQSGVVVISWVESSRRHHLTIVPH